MNSKCQRSMFTCSQGDKSRLSQNPRGEYFQVGFKQNQPLVTQKILTCVNLAVPPGTSSVFPNRVLFHSINYMPDFALFHLRRPSLLAPQLSSFQLFSLKSAIHCNSYMPGEVITEKRLKDIPLMSNGGQWNSKN